MEEQRTAGCNTLIRDGHRKRRRAAACGVPGSSFVCVHISCLIEVPAGHTVPGRPFYVRAWEAVGRMVEIDDVHVVVRMQEGDKASLDGGE